MLGFGLLTYTTQYTKNADDSVVGVYGTKALFFPSSDLKNSWELMKSASIVAVVFAVFPVVYRIRQVYRMIRGELITKTVVEADTFQGKYNGKKEKWRQTLNAVTFILMIVIYRGIEFPELIKGMLIVVMIILAYTILCNLFQEKKAMRRYLEANDKFGTKLKSLSLHLIIFLFGFTYIPISQHALGMFQCVPVVSTGFYIPKSVKMNLQDYLYSKDLVHTPFLNCTQNPIGKCSEVAFNTTCTNYTGTMLSGVRLNALPELDCSTESRQYAASAILALLAITISLPFMYFILIHKATNIVNAVKTSTDTKDPWNVKMEKVTVACSALFEMFKYKARYTKLLFLFQRILFVIIAIYLPVSVSPFLLMGIQIIALFAYIKVLPYRETQENLLAISLCGAQIQNLLVIGIASTGNASDALFILSAIIIATAPTISLVYKMYLKRLRTKKEEIDNIDKKEKKTRSLGEFFKFLKKRTDDNENVEGLAMTIVELKEYVKGKNVELLQILDSFFILISVLLVIALGVSLGKFFHFLRNAARTDAIITKYSGFPSIDEYRPPVLVRGFRIRSIDLNLLEYRIATNLTYGTRIGISQIDWRGQWRNGCCCTVEKEPQKYSNITTKDRIVYNYKMNMIFENWRCNYDLKGFNMNWMNSTGGNPEFNIKKAKIIQERLLRKVDIEMNIDARITKVSMSGEWIRPLCGTSVKSTCTIGRGASRHPYSDCTGTLDFGMSSKADIFLDQFLDPNNFYFKQLTTGNGDYRQSIEQLYMWLDLSWLVYDDNVNDDRSYFIIVSLVVPLVMISIMILLFRANWENISFVVTMLGFGLLTYTTQYPQLADESIVGVYGKEELFFASSDLKSSWGSIKATAIIAVVLSLVPIAYRIRAVYRLVRGELKTTNVTENDQLYGGHNSQKSGKRQALNVASLFILAVIYNGIKFPAVIAAALVIVMFILTYIILCNASQKTNFKPLAWCIEKNIIIGNESRAISLHLIIFLFGFTYIPISQYALGMLQCIPIANSGFYMPKSVKMNLKDYLYAQSDVHSPFLECSQTPSSSCSTMAYNTTCTNFAGNMLTGVRINASPELDCSTESFQYTSSAIMAIVAITIALPFMYYILIHKATNIVKAVKASPDAIDPWDVKMEKVTVACSALFSMFKYKARFTKLLFLFQRIIFVLIAIYTPVSAAPFLLMIIQMIALALYLKYFPYRGHQENFLAISLCVAQIVNLIIVGIASTGHASNELLILSAFVIAIAPTVSLSVGIYFSRKKKRKEYLDNPDNANKVFSFKQYWKDFLKKADENENVEGLAVTVANLKDYVQSQNVVLLGTLDNFFLIISIFLVIALGISLGSFFHFFRNAIRTDSLQPYGGYTKVTDEYMPNVVVRGFPDRIMDKSIADNRIATNLTYGVKGGVNQVDWSGGKWRDGCCCTLESKPQIYSNSSTKYGVAYEYSMEMIFENWRCNYDMKTSMSWRNAIGALPKWNISSTRPKIIHERLLRKVDIKMKIGNAPVNITSLSGDWIRPMCGVAVNINCSMSVGLARHPFADCAGVTPFGMSYTTADIYLDQFLDPYSNHYTLLQSGNYKKVYEQQLMW